MGNHIFLASKEILRNAVSMEYMVVFAIRWKGLIQKS